MIELLIYNVGGQLVLRGTAGPRTRCPRGTRSPRTSWHNLSWQGSYHHWIEPLSMGHM